MSQLIYRRRFLAASAGSAVAFNILSSVRGADAPSEKVRVAVMGLGRGNDIANTLTSVPGAEVRYVCDVDDARIGNAVKMVEKKSGTAPLVEKDIRRILDDKDVDAIAIAAPDHWHAPATILACAAGKHVYVEKPCSHNAREGELALEAARKYKRVVQHGTQRRSWAKVAEAVQRLREGVIGRVIMSRGWYNNRRGSIGRGTPAPAPPGLNYDLWQGPAPERPYRSNVVHYNWHWFWHWGTAELGNNGIHSLDICRWGLGVDYPTRVTSAGGRYHFEDDQETPDTHLCTFEFPDDKIIAWEGRSCHPHGFEGSGFGISFFGEGGSLLITDAGYRILDKNDKEVQKVTGNAGDVEHLKNFLNCMRDGKKPVADIEEAHKSTVLCHLGNIAYRTGRAINTDVKTGRIVGDEEAMKMWGREYRKGWEPKV